MKNFLQQIQQALSDSQLYKHALHGEESRNYGFLFKLSLVAGLLMSVLAIFAFIFGFKPFITQVIEKGFPNDLEVSFVAGELSINKEVPYALPLSTFDDELGSKSHIIDMEEVTIIIVIDTNTTRASTTLDTFSQYSTFILFVRDGVVVSDGNKFEVMNFSSIKDQVITKTKAQASVEQLISFMWLLMPVVCIVLILFTFIGALSVIFLTSFILWVIYRILGKNFLLKHIITASIYGYTFISLLQICAFLGLNLGISSYVLILIGVVMLGYYLSEKK